MKKRNNMLDLVVIGTEIASAALCLYTLKKMDDVNKRADLLAEDNRSLEDEIIRTRINVDGLLDDSLENTTEDTDADSN